MYYVIVQSFPLDSSDVRNTLRCIDKSGTTISETELSAGMNIYVGSDISDGQLLYVTYSGELEKADIKTGEIVSSLPSDNQLCGVYVCNDGYVLLSVGRIDKYDKEDRLIASIENPDWCYYNGYRTFYSDNGKYYLLSDTGFRWKYYELDFDNSTSRMIYDPTAEDPYVLSCSGKYIFDEDGEYLIDFKDSKKISLAKWSEMDLMPPQYTRSNPNYIGVDNDSFLQIYNYDNGTAQLVIYNYEEGVDYNDRTVITVGGFNCRYDLPLNWAIYRYNTSQTEYRVVIEDYSDEFGWDSAEQAISQRAALLKYFSEGNTPDIFYGDYFDYDSLAESGEVLDMNQYMSDELHDRLEGITPSIRRLMIMDNGECYRLFSSYQIEGYISSFDIGKDQSIDDVIKLAYDNNVSLISNESASSLAKHAIQFSLCDSGPFNVQDIQHILEYAFEFGYQDSTEITGSELNGITVNDYLLWNANVYSVLRMYDIVRDCKTDFVYVGYPTLSGSKHVIIPFGQVAVSSSADHPEECVSFISYLLDDEVQDLNNLGCYIPVNDKSMRKMVDYSLSHSSIPEEDYEYYLYLSIQNEIDDKTADCFYDLIDSVDTVRYYDWGVEGIITEEIETYYTQDKTAEQIADVLYSRLKVYVQENYS